MAAPTLPWHPAPLRSFASVAAGWLLWTLPIAALPHSSPFRLFLHGQNWSSPWVRFTNPKVQHSTPAHTGRFESQAGVYSVAAQTVGLSVFCLPQATCGTLLWASKFPFVSWLIPLTVSVQEPVFFSAPSQMCRSPLLPHSTPPPRPPLSYWLCGYLSYLFRCWRSSASVQEVFCDNCSIFRCILICICGRRCVPHSALLPSWTPKVFSFVMDKGNLYPFMKNVFFMKLFITKLFLMAFYWAIFCSCV